MSYFNGVRLYAGIESIVFTALLVVWIGGLDEGTKQVLGWVHGFGWIALCLLVLYGWLRRIFPGPLLAATVSPLGPLGALLGFEVLVRRQPRPAATVRPDVPAQPPEPAHAVPDPAGAGAGGGAARRHPGRVAGGRDRVRGRGDH